MTCERSSGNNKCGRCRERRAVAELQVNGGFLSGMKYVLRVASAAGVLPLP